MAANRCIDMFSKSFYRSNANNNVFLFVRNIRWNTLTRNFSFSYQKYRDSKTVEENFEQIFRESQFVKLGRPRGKTVTGKVIHISGTENDDLYVDFGWKFYAVVKRPSSKKGLPYMYVIWVKGIYFHSCIVLILFYF